MSYNLELIHKRELLMLSEFIRICNKFNLKYYMLGGTLLGAVRHRGFIPWDDDIDLGMPREDFEKFKQVVNKEIIKPFYCENDKDIKSYKLAYMKFCDSDTKVYWEHNGEKKVVNLWMDIFPIDGMPRNFFKRKIHEISYLYTRMMVNLSQLSDIVDFEKRNRPIHERLIITLSKFLSLEKFLNYDRRQENYIKTISKYKVSEKYSGNYTGAYKLRELVPSEYFGNGKLLEFEGLQVKGPDKFNDYLEAIYGNDFMELPPIDSRQSHGLEIVN